MTLYEVILTVHIISFVWNIVLVISSDLTGLWWVLGKIERVPATFLQLTHKLIWVGLGMSILSGIYLFSTASEYLLSVPAFYTKISLVLALLINAFYIGKHIKVAASKPFREVGKNEKTKLFISGAVSTIGWVGVIVSAKLLGL